MPKSDKIFTTIASVKFQLFLSLASVATVLIGAFITIRLAPLYQGQIELITRVNALEKVQENNISKDTFNVLEVRINYISARVDAIYQILASKFLK